MRNFHRNFSFLIHRGIVWCPVYKAASSTWLSNVPFLINEDKKRSKTKRLVEKLRGLFDIDIPIDANDFLFFFADIFSTVVSSGLRVDMCRRLRAAALVDG